MPNPIQHMLNKIGTDHRQIQQRINARLHSTIRLCHNKSKTKPRIKANTNLDLKQSISSNKVRNTARIVNQEGDSNADWSCDTWIKRWRKQRGSKLAGGVVRLRSRSDYLLCSIWTGSTSLRPICFSFRSNSSIPFELLPLLPSVLDFVESESIELDVDYLCWTVPLFYFFLVFSRIQFEFGRCMEACFDSTILQWWWLNSDCFCAELD